MGYARALLGHHKESQRSGLILTWHWDQRQVVGKRHARFLWPGYQTNKYKMYMHMYMCICVYYIYIPIIYISVYIIYMPLVCVCMHQTHQSLQFDLSLEYQHLMSYHFHFTYINYNVTIIYPLVNQPNYGKSPFWMCKSTISTGPCSMANCLPSDNHHIPSGKLT